MMEYTITASFIALDFVTGLFKAFATKTFTTTKMRQGLWHKASLLLIILLGVLVDYAQGYLDIGVSVPVAAAVCAYIVLMEIASVIENACAINPDLMPDKLTALFGGNTNKDDNEEDKDNG